MAENEAESIEEDEVGMSETETKEENVVESEEEEIEETASEEPSRGNAVPKRKKTEAETVPALLKRRTPKAKKRLRSLKKRSTQFRFATSGS